VRFLKFFAITFISLFIVFIITYNARVAIINKVAQTQLGLASLNIRCLDFSLSTDISIVIDKLCLQSPKADIDIEGMVIQWQGFSDDGAFTSKKTKSNINITAVDIKFIGIKAKEHFFANINVIPSTNEQPKSNQNLTVFLSTTLTSYTEQIQQVQQHLLPIKLNVTKLYYSPFIANNNAITNESPYIGSISTIDNSFAFLLKNAQESEVINVTLNQEKEGFSIALASELGQIKNFVSMHQLPVSKALQNDLKHNDIAGKLNGLITYQDNSLSMQNTITDLKINSDQGIGTSGAFNLSGDLNFKTKFTLTPIKPSSNQAVESNITLQFVDKNELFLKYSEIALLKRLEESEISPTVIAILKDNPVNQLVLKPKGEAKLTLNDHKLQLEHIAISLGSNSHKKIHHMTFDNTLLTLEQSSNSYSIVDNKLTEVKNVPEQQFAINSFLIDSSLNLASVPSIAQLTTEPLTVHLAGSFQQTDHKTAVNFTDNTAVSLKNIAVTTITAEKKQIVAAANALTTQLTGSVQQLVDSSIHLNLTVHNQASQLNVPNILKIETFDLSSHIIGGLENINITASAIADGVNLGDITVTGPIQSPKLAILANDLALTDLLSLNISLPITVELIEGRLDYHVSSAQVDLTNIENTQFDTSIAIESLSGEVDGIWLQGLYWQQEFSLLAGNLVTKVNDQENLKIALIETFSPITHLSVNTQWSLNNSHFKLAVNKLKADGFGGNFVVPNIKWPFEQGHSANVQLNSIDLEQVLALDKKQGIVVTGNISGQLPIMFDGERFIVEAGELHNVSNGLIQVINNPAVAELKANNSQLQLAFDALENLHYHQLSSAVSMADDGYMQLDTVIKGRNPDIDNDVNLNLNLTYDLLGLLESLSITQRFEDSIIKGLQKNKE